MVRPLHGVIPVDVAVIMKQKYGPWALILGASYGVGEEFSRQTAAEGINLVMLARNKAGLNRLADDIAREYGVQTRTIAADLSLPGAAAQILSAVEDLEIGLMIYNAGAPSSAAAFTSAPMSHWTGQLHLNVVNMMDLCHSLGAGMQQRGRGGILLVGSQAGLGGNKLFSVYTASKGFMLNFGETLWLEWAGSGVDVRNFLITIVDGPTLRRQMKASNVPGWDQPDIGVPQPVDVARSGLRELGNGPTFLHPEDEQLDPGEASEGSRRREAMAERWAITSQFVGDV